MINGEHLALRTFFFNQGKSAKSEHLALNLIQIIVPQEAETTEGRWLCGDTQQENISQGWKCILWAGSPKGQIDPDLWLPRWEMLGMGTDSWLDSLIPLTRVFANHALLLARRMPSSALLVSFLAAYGLKIKPRLGQKASVQVGLLQLQQIPLHNMRASLPKIQQYFMQGSWPLSIGLWNILQEKVLSLVREN